MTIQHSLLTGADLHEPKGVATAPNKAVYAADGAGSGAWALPVLETDAVATSMIQDAAITGAKMAYARGSCYFFNESTPSTVTYSASAVKITPTTTALGIALHMTEGTDAKLTYTGTPTKTGIIRCQLSLAQSSGSDKNVKVSIHKNGVAIPGADTLVTNVSGAYHSVTFEGYTVANTNDYYEAYITNLSGSGDTDVHQLTLTLNLLG